MRKPDNIRTKTAAKWSLLVLLGYLILGAHTGIAAERSDLTDTERAISLYQNGNETDAVRALIQLAYQGNVASQFNLGVISMQRGDDPIAVKEARFWFERAAEEGDVGAQYNLGMLLLNGESSDSLRAAVSWLERAAEGGASMAQVNLGILSIWWPDFPVGKELGRRWLALAAEEGNVAATRALELGEDNAVAGTALGLLYPIDTVLRSEVSRGDSRVRRESAPIYALPTGRQEPLDILPENSVVEVLKKSSGWVNVRTVNGLPVWIMAGMVEIVGKQATVTVLEAALYVTPELDPEVYKVGSVTKGESLSILNRQQDWLLVLAPKRFTGWMREDDVEVRVSSLPVEQSQPEIASQNNTDGSTDPAGTAGNLPLSTAEAVAIEGDLKSMQVAMDSLVYIENREGAEVLGVVPEAAEVLAGRDRSGYRLTVDVPVSGWIYAKLVTRSNGSGFVNYQGARVRTKPDLGGQVISIYQLGQEVRIIEESGNWYRIALAANNGWIQSSKLTPANNTEKIQSLQEVIKAAKETESRTLTEAGTVTDQVPKAESAIEIAKDTILYSAESEKSQFYGRLIGAVEIDQTDVEGEMVQIPLAVTTYGWVYAQLISEDGSTGTVTRDGARVRLDPDTSVNNIVRSYNKGNTLEIIERVDDWYRISLGAHEGWAVSKP
ncbi:MAG: SH3 domain-containing protein [bacterium]